MKKDRNTYLTILYIVLNIVLLLIAAISIGGSSADALGYYEDISSGWKRVLETDGANIQYENTIPSVQCNAPAIAIKTAWAEFEVTVDGKQVFYYEDTRHVNGSNYVLIPMENSVAGKKVVLRSYGRKDLLSRAVKYKSYYGDKYSIYRGVLRDNAQSVLLCAIFINNAILIWITMLRYRKNASIRALLMFWYQSMFAIFFGIWLLADSDFIAFILNAPRSATYLTYISLYLLPVFALLFIDKLYVYENKSIKLYEALFIVGAITLLVLKELHIVEFYESVDLVIGTIAGFAIFFVAEPIRDILVYKNRLMKRALMGVPVLIVFLIIAVCRYIFFNGDGYSYIVSVGILIFMIFPYLETVRLAKNDKDFDRLVREIKIEKNIDLATGFKNMTALMSQDVNGEGQIYVYLSIDNYGDIRVEDGYQTSVDLIKYTTDSLLSVFKNAGEYYRLSNEVFLIQIKRNSISSVEDMLVQFVSELKQKCGDENIGVEISGSIIVRKNSMANSQMLEEAKRTAVLL